MIPFVPRTVIDRLASSRAAAALLSIAAMTWFCVLRPLPADARAYMGWNKVKDGPDPTTYVRSSPQGPFIGTIHPGTNVYVESRNSLYQSPKAGKWVWGMVEGMMASKVVRGCQ